MRPLPLLPDRVDGRDGVCGADDRCRELGRGVEEGVDDELIESPEPQSHTQDDRDEEDPLDPLQNGFLNLAGERKVSPDHHVERCQRDYRGLDRGRQCCRLRAYELSELRDELRPKLPKEHGLAPEVSKIVRRHFDLSRWMRRRPSRWGRMACGWCACCKRSG